MPFEAPGPVVTKKRARMVALMYPKAGLSFEEIDRYWGEEHARIFSSIDIVKKNLIKYEQFHFKPDVNAALVQQGVAAMPYIGIATFEAESVEQILEIFQDPEYLRIIVPDENKFLDREKSSLIAGEFADVLRR